MSAMKENEREVFRQSLSKLRETYNDSWEDMPLEFFIDGFVGSAKVRSSRKRLNEISIEITDENSRVLRVPHPPQCPRRNSKNFTKSQYKRLAK